jgi:predicted transcriptional regulator
MSKVIDEIRDKLNEFMNYLETSRMIAEDMVKNKKKLKEIKKELKEKK